MAKKGMTKKAIGEVAKLNALNKTANRGLTGRQQVKMKKLERDRATQRTAARTKAAIAIAGEAGSTATAMHGATESGKTQREALRQQSYQAALNKWNGAVMNTPDPAEGTSNPTDGSRGDNNYTGTQWGYTPKGE